MKKEKMVNISLFITEQELQVKNDVPAINVCGFIEFVHQTLTNLLAIVKQLKHSDLCTFGLFNNSLSLRSKCTKKNFLFCSETYQWRRKFKARSLIFAR